MNTLNFNDIPEKSYSSINEFVNFNDLPDSPPLIVINSECDIVYGNSVFLAKFKLNGGINLRNIQDFEPVLTDLFEVFLASKLHYFHFDINFDCRLNETELFLIDMEKVVINRQEFYLIIFRSMEEKKKLEEKIIDLNNALDYGNVPLVILDEYGKIKYSTKSFEEIINTSIEVIYNQEFPKVLKPFLSDADQLSLVDAVSAKTKWNKIVIISKNKSTTFKEINLVPVIKEPAGNFSFIVSANDITDYILKNRIIKKSESQLKSIINNISDLLVILRQVKGKTYFENANENFCTVFHIDKEKNKYNNINSLFIGEFKEQLNKCIEEYRINKENNNFECKYEERIYTGNISSFEAEQYEHFLIISFKDITDQKEYEIQLEKSLKKEAYLNKLKTNFLETMSHEIRTPFNAIAGYSEIIEECSENGDVETMKELSGLVKDVLSRILNLFTNIVEVSQIESGEYLIEKKQFDLVNLLQNIYIKKQDDALIKQLQFILNIENEEVLINSDQTKISKIISVIVENAIKYTSEGEISITLSRIDDSAVIKISDTGKGIEEGQISKLLEPFCQEEESYSRNHEGAGLGLTIAYKLTNILNGKFDIQSTKNQGTSVIIQFPL